MSATDVLSPSCQASSTSDRLHQWDDLGDLPSTRTRSKSCIPEITLSDRTLVILPSPSTKSHGAISQHSSPLAQTHGHQRENSIVLAHILSEQVHMELRQAQLVKSLFQALLDDYVTFSRDFSASTAILTQPIQLDKIRDTLRAEIKKRIYEAVGVQDIAEYQRLAHLHNFISSVHPLNLDKCTLMHFGILAKDPQTFQFIVEHCNIDEIDHPWGVHPIHFAAASGNIERYHTIQGLMSEHPLSVLTRFNWSVVQFSIQSPNADLLQWIVGNTLMTRDRVIAECELLLPDKNGNTPVHTAARLVGKEEHLRVFQKNRLLTVPPNKQGYTPLLLSLKCGSPEAFSMIRETIQGNEVWAAHHKYRPFDPPKEEIPMEVRSKLLGSECPTKLSAFHLLATSEQPVHAVTLTTELLSLLQKKKESLFTDGKGVTPPHLAAFFGNFDVINVYAQNPGFMGYITETDDYGNGIVMYALARGHLSQLVEYMSKRGFPSAVLGKLNEKQHLPAMLEFERLHKQQQGTPFVPISSGSLGDDRAAHNRIIVDLQSIVEYCKLVNMIS